MEISQGQTQTPKLIIPILRSFSSSLSTCGTEPYWHCIVPHLEKPLSNFISQANLRLPFGLSRQRPTVVKTTVKGFGQGFRRSCWDAGTLLVVYSNDTWIAPGEAPCYRMSRAPWNYKPVFLPGKAHNSSAGKRTLICFPLMLINDSAFHLEWKINSESILHASWKGFL